VLPPLLVTSDKSVARGPQLGGPDCKAFARPRCSSSGEFSQGGTWLVFFPKRSSALLGRRLERSATLVGIYNALSGAERAGKAL
jgi:hypothetical protein